MCGREQAGGGCLCCPTARQGWGTPVYIFCVRGNGPGKSQAWGEEQTGLAYGCSPELSSSSAPPNPSPICTPQLSGFTQQLVFSKGFPILPPQLPQRIGTKASSTVVPSFHKSPVAVFPKSSDA